MTKIDRGTSWRYPPAAPKLRSNFPLIAARKLVYDRRTISASRDNYSFFRRPVSAANARNSGLGHPVYLRSVTFTSDYRLSRTSSVDARKTISGEYSAGFIVIGGNDGFTPPPPPPSPPPPSPPSPPTTRLSSVVRFVSMYGRKSPEKPIAAHVRTYVRAYTRIYVGTHACT